MSGPKTPPPPRGTPEEERQSEKQPDRRSGRVAFDERGNAVWEWSMSTGIFARNVDTKRLKKLEANDLKLADEAAAAPTPKEAARPNPTKPAGGFDPYNSAGPAPRRGIGTKPAAAKPKDLRRLGSWIELQKTMGKKPDKD